MLWWNWILLKFENSNRVASLPIKYDMALACKSIHYNNPFTFEGKKIDPLSSRFPFDFEPFLVKDYSCSKFLRSFEENRSTVRRISGMCANTFGKNYLYSVFSSLCVTHNTLKRDHTCAKARKSHPLMHIDHTKLWKWSVIIAVNFPI